MATKIVERTLSRDTPRPKVLIVGMGGLGCPVAELLHATQACTLVLCDGDIVDRSNLPRQWLYDEADVGKPKTEAALARLPGSETRSAFTQMDSLDGYALVIDGSDDIDLKFALSDKAVATGVPIVTGGVIGTNGFVCARAGDGVPCLRCIFEGPTEETRRTCRDAGVLSSLAPVVGSVMAAAALRVLAEGASSQMWSIDLTQGAARSSEWPKRADCPACGARA